MDELEAAILHICGAPVESIRRFAGGDISGASEVRLTDDRKIVVKRGPVVDREARMLEAIHATGTPVPTVFGIHGDVMAISHVESGGQLVGEAWDSLADALLRLNHVDADTYGWPEDYALRDVTVQNTPHPDWDEFWAQHRLLCHVPHLEASLGRRVEGLAARMGDILPARPPIALVHGDLWGGNVVVGPGGDVSLIDPCACHGHGEVDAATLTVFDRPPDRFFDALGLAPGWRERQPVYRLWTWLVHVRLFGSGYRAAAEKELSTLGF